MMLPFRRRDSMFASRWVRSRSTSESDLDGATGSNTVVNDLVQPDSNMSASIHDAPTSRRGHDANHHERWNAPSIVAEPSWSSTCIGPNVGAATPVAEARERLSV